MTIERGSAIHPWAKPIDNHRRFMVAGQLCRTMITPFARLDLPRSLNVLADRPMLFAGNHRSYFDFFVTLVMFSQFNASSRILIRADLVNSGPSGRVLRGLGSIPVSSATAEAAEDEAVAALIDGQTVSIMPEGRLVPEAERAETGVGPGRPGVSRIARRSGAAVFPVAFVGTEKVWPRGEAPRIRPGRRPVVRLRVGEPVEFTSDDHRANTDGLMEVLADLVRRTEAED